MSEKESEWAAKAVERANHKAARIALAMQCKLDGVAQCSVASLDQGLVPRTFAAPSAAGDFESASRMRRIDIGTSLVQTKMAGVRVTLMYRLERKDI